MILLTEQQRLTIEAARDANEALKESRVAWSREPASDAQARATYARLTAAAAFLPELLRVIDILSDRLYTFEATKSE